jgi:hypothetical protein
MAPVSEIAVSAPSTIFMAAPFRVLIRTCWTGNWMLSILHLGHRMFIATRRCLLFSQSVPSRLGSCSCVSVADRACEPSTPRAENALPFLTWDIGGGIVFA